MMGATNGGEMRSRTGVLAGLGLLLALGVAVAVFVLSAEPDTPPHSAVTHTTPESPASESTDALPDPEPTPEPDPETETAWIQRSAALTLHGTVSIRLGRESTPAEGAQVRVELAPAPDDATFRNAKASASTATSDADGAYRLEVALSWEEPKEGEHTAPALVVTAEREACLPGTARVQGVDDPEPRRDLLLLHATAARGRVINAATREPIEGAQVRIGALGRFHDHELFRTWKRTETAEDGRFLLEGLAAGDVRLEIQAQGYAWANQRTITGSGLDPLAGRRILSLRFTPDGMYVNDLGDIVLRPTSAVTGRVVHPKTGEPVRGASVLLRVRDDDDWHKVASGSAADSGEFRFEDVPPGTYAVLALEHQTGMHLREEVDVPAHTTVDLGTLPLSMGEVLHGRIVDSSGEGVSGRIVIGFDEWSRSRTAWVASSVIHTHEDGTFEVHGMLASEYGVHFSGNVGGHHEATFTYPIDFLELRLPRGGTLRGTLELASGASPDGAEVLCGPLTDEMREGFADRPELLEAHLPLFHEALTTGRHFEFEDLPPGRYMIVATSRGARAKGFAYDIEVRDGEIAEVGTIQLNDAGRVSVTVRRDGAPALDVPVWLYDGAMNRMGRDLTASSGQARFLWLPPGQYTVLLEAEDEEHFPDSRTVAVRGGETVELVIDLDGTNDTGLEIVWDGTPALTPEVAVFQAEPPHTIVRYSAIPESGVCRVVYLKPGAYFAMLSDWRRGLVQRHGPFEVRAGEVTRVPLSHASHRVSGRVIVPGGAPFWADGASVRLAEADSPLSPHDMKSFTLRGSIHPDGSFEFEYVADGEYILTATLHGYGHLHRNVSVRGQSVSGIELALSAEQGALRVQITGISGSLWENSEGTRVQLLDSLGRDVFLNYSDRLDLGIHVDGIAPGVYTLKFHVRGLLPVVRKGVTIRNAEVSLVAVRVRPSGELHVVALNPEVAAPRLKRAQVTLFDAEGVPVELTAHPLDNDPEDYCYEYHHLYEHATLRVRNLGPDVKRVRIEVPGYEPLDLTYNHTPGTIQRHRVEFTPAE
jgi:hypothetical protein